MKHRLAGAKIAAGSHAWAIERIDGTSKQLGINFEYCILPDHEISQYEKGHEKHDEEMKMPVENVNKAVELGICAFYAFDIESLDLGRGGVLNPQTSKLVVAYRDDQGEVHKYSAVCHHLQGVVCSNRVEKWNLIQRRWWWCFRTCEREPITG